MERRNFIRTGCNACMALGSAVFISSLASCSPKLSVSKVTPKDMKFSIPQSDMATSDVRIVALKNFDYDVFIKKNEDGTFFALAMMCTHAGHPLVRTGNKFYCSLHGSEFDITGSILKGPAEKKLVHLPLNNNNGLLEITLKNSSEIW